LQLVNFFRDNKFLETDFRGSNTNRLVKLKSLIKNNEIDNNLRLKKV